LDTIDDSTTTQDTRASKEGGSSPRSKISSVCESVSEKDLSPRSRYKKKTLTEKAEECRNPKYYRDYFHLDTILKAQQPLSELQNDGQHDEMLFIINHQAYELWFKQILHELRSVHSLFSAPVANSSLSVICSRLQRIHTIQQVLLQQLTVFETMSPMEFNSFRPYFDTASGFQSVQFRCIEMLLGLGLENRRVGTKKFLTSMSDEADRKLLTE